MRDVKEERKARILEAYKDYVELRRGGHSHVSAMAHFDHMHPTTVSSLEKYIRNTYPLKRKKEGAA